MSVTIIATVIADSNIALSLGMIGALSIVRFRHPVKNSLELIIFFCLLTLGVATSVELIWAIFITCSCGGNINIHSTFK